MESLRPCLVFREGAEEAINLYISLFKNSAVMSLNRSDGSGLIPAGKVLHAAFKLDGQEFTAFDGGPAFEFSEGFSLVATCSTQAEIDQLWARLTANGGEGGRCGWLKDRFGMSWQIVPAALGRMLTDASHGNAAKVTQEMLKMSKLDVATLEAAYRDGK